MKHSENVVVSPLHQHRRADSVPTKRKRGIKVALELVLIFCSTALIVPWIVFTTQAHTDADSFGFISPTWDSISQFALPTNTAPRNGAVFSESSPDSFSLNENDHDSVLRSLQELTRSPAPGSIVCSSPHLTPIYDKILYSSYGSTRNETQSRVNRKIPHILHISFNHRCVPNELADSIDRWKEVLPDHSMFFHDDEAVQRLIYGNDLHHRTPLWQSSEEFPELLNHMRCIKFKGAMLIDVWRMLVVWTYGGIYTDIDNWPGPKFDGRTTIREGDSCFALSDGKDRPSQWLFGMTPRHPVAIFTLQEISRRLLKMKNIARPRVVHITGPQAMKTGYRKFKELLKRNATIFGASSYYTQDRKIEVKESDNYARGGLGGTFDEIVDRFYDVTSNTTYFNITKREKVQLVSGIKHWTEDVKLNVGKSGSTGKLSSNGIDTDTDTGADLKAVDSSASDNDPRLGSYDGVSCWDYLTALDAFDGRPSKEAG
mmetsp:Transcript_5287/g.15379  ORF Transcript_5287/g.15379 Transcript_5287/m.15379 type:complete len:486 (+) Transcript_5287:245-1702(+)